MNGLGNPLLLASMALTSVSLVKNKNFIQENWKPILGIGAALGATFLIWRIYSDITSKPTPGGLEENPFFEKSSLTLAEAAIKADRLEKSMKTFGETNAEEAAEIKDVLQDMSYNDFIKISKAFGERRYIAATGIAQGWPAPEHNLVYWLTNELKTEDLNALRQIIPNVF